MLPKEENELLCRIGPGTTMGELLRQYWIPGLPAAELPEPDCRPKRVRLLGENMVAFRDSRGEAGMLAENCPHRGASLFFGRNEEAGLRCVYHGWKFDTAGHCVDMPNEPPDRRGTACRAPTDKVRARAYPCRDVNGMIWIYMGPRETPPPLPAFEINTLPADHVLPPSIMLEENNWVQGLEGDIDSSHIDWVHGRLHENVQLGQGLNRGFYSFDKRPRMEVLSTPYGAVYSARRQWEENGPYWHRITQYIMPFLTMIAASPPDRVHVRAWVPLDDNWNMLITMSGLLSRPVTDEERARAANLFGPAGGYVEPTSDPTTRYYTKANLQNDFNIDYEAQKTRAVSGIPFAGNLQDRAMTETMGTIYDRSQEHLGTSDAMVIQVRRALLAAARALQEDGAP
ncbi:MAG TPA: Rieske 2Fe-2S domain-containing protein, partial [Dehalococcoidia bacterium]|nr:Rieske 2Fe-2S domain-containing protein [Dehalococcoidia bacterium]